MFYLPRCWSVLEVLGDLFWPDFRGARFNDAAIFEWPLRDIPVVYLGAQTKIFLNAYENFLLLRILPDISLFGSQGWLQKNTLPYPFDGRHIRSSVDVLSCHVLKEIGSQWRLLLYRVPGFSASASENCTYILNQLLSEGRPFNELWFAQSVWIIRDERGGTVSVVITWHSPWVHYHSIYHCVFSWWDNTSVINAAQECNRLGNRQVKNTAAFLRHHGWFARTLPQRESSPRKAWFRLLLRGCLI